MLFDPDEALKPDAILIHPDLGKYDYNEHVLVKQPGTNIANLTRVRKGDIDEGLKKSDLVVEGTNGRRSAIQCDGDRAFDPDGLVEGMEGQITLERRDWEFLRVRASEFYRSPDRTLKKLERRLAGLEIRPLPEGSAVAVRDTKPAPHRGAPPS